MTIKFSKEKVAEASRLNQAEWHRRVRADRRNQIIARLGGECQQCGATDDLYCWYTWKPEEQGIRPWQSVRKGQEAVDAINLNRYHLLCMKHWRERQQEEKPKRQHGTAATYAGSGRVPCRCALCTAAWNHYTKKWHKEHKRKRREARRLLKDEAFKRLFKN